MKLTLPFVAAMLLARTAAYPADLDLTPGELDVRKHFPADTMRLWPGEVPDEPRPIPSRRSPVRRGHRQTTTHRAKLKLAIEDMLDGGLPRAYDKPLYEQKCSCLFEHFYENYPERDGSVHAEAG